MITMEYIDILLFGAVAGIILFRLWSVLGTRTGHEAPPAEAEARRAPTAPAPAADNAPVIAPRPLPNYPAAAARGLADIAGVTRNFDPESFMAGAAMAHERVIEAFAAGDRDELKMMLGDEVYAAFDRAIAAREARGLVASTVVVKAGTPQMVSAALKGRMAEIDVRYEDELIQFSRNAAGETVEGSESAVKRVTDRWTWVRDTRASDPNWKLADTDYGD